MLQKKKTKKEIITALKNAWLVIIGSAVLAFGFGVFLMPFDLIIGGVSGLAIVLRESLPFDFITVDVYVAILTWALFFLGLIFLGRAFSVKTLISTIVYPVALSLSMKLVSPDVLDGFFMFAAGREDDLALLLVCAIFGGAVVGTGCALAYRGGGSTGGLDILALILAKYVKKLKSSVAIFLCDAIVIVLGIFFFKDMISCLLGIGAAFISALVIDKIFLGESAAFIANIVSDKYLEMNEAIIKKLDRTSTVITATGGYSGESKPMLMVSFSMHEYAAFSAIIAMDREAFVTVHRAHEINGEGWTKHDLDRVGQNKLIKEKEKNNLP